MHTKEKVAALSMAGILALMFVLPSMAAAATPPRYDLTGTWSFNDDGYIHTMVINSFNPLTGAFSGIGYYTGDSALTWTITGTEAGTTITYVLVTGGDTPGVTLTGTGTLTSSTSMSGTGCQSNISPPCPNVTWSATKGTQVLNINFLVTNDEDSGFVGYWALDSYIKTVQVWQDPNVPSNHFVTSTYLGLFQTFAGALSPQNGVVEPKGGAGILTGAYFGQFTFTGTISSLKTSGYIGLYNYGGTKADVLKGTYGAGQTGDPPTAFSWLSTYFPGYTSFTYLSSPSLTGGWVWTYHYFGQTWVNAASGSSGDIVT